MTRSRHAAALLGMALAVSGVSVGCDKETKAPPEEAADTGPVRWVPLASSADVDQTFKGLLSSAKKKQRPVVVDFWAEWCVPCKRMDKVVFTAPEVVAALRRFELIKVDTTSDTMPLQKIQARYSVTSMPTLLFFGPDGTLLDDLRIGEFVDAKRLVAQLEKVPARSSARPR